MTSRPVPLGPHARAATSALPSGAGQARASAPPAKWWSVAQRTTAPAGPPQELYRLLSCSAGPASQPAGPTQPTFLPCWAFLESCRPCCASTSTHLDGHRRVSALQPVASSTNANKLLLPCLHIRQPTSTSVPQRISAARASRTSLRCARVRHSASLRRSRPRRSHGVDANGPRSTRARRKWTQHSEDPRRQCVRLQSQRCHVDVSANKGEHFQRDAPRRLRNKPLTTGRH